jgi:hypothetical protein
MKTNVPENIMKNKNEINKLLIKELALYQDARVIANHDLSFNHLGRAHIIAQGRWFHHFYIHFLMFEYAWRRKDYKEVWGQTLRMMATIPGHLFGRLPTGNIGWSTVPLNQKMPLPEDLKRLLS